MKEKGIPKTPHRKKRVSAKPVKRGHNSANGSLAAPAPENGKQVVKGAVKNDVVCVIGMHRSGTSLAAHLLHLCGLDLGPPEKFMEANDSNPRGFFENNDFTYKINTALLDRLGGSWDNLPQPAEGWEYKAELAQIVHEAQELVQSFSKSKLWGWKDPRTTVLLPFWKSLIPNLRFVICVRSPLEVAQSLARRDRIALKKGVHLWHQYIRAAIQDTEGYDRVFLFYEDLFKDPAGEIDRLIQFTGLKKPRNLATLTDAISPKLKHHTMETHELLNENKLMAEQMLLYIGLRAFTTHGFADSAPTIDRETLISGNISKFFRLLEKFHDEQTLAQLQSELADKDLKLTNVFDTFDRLKETQAQKEAQLSELATEHQTLQKELNNLQAVLNEKATEVSNLTAEQERLVREAETQQSLTETLQQKLQEKDEEVSNLTVEQQRLAQEAKTGQSMAETLQRKLEEKDKEVSNLTTEQQRLAQEAKTGQSMSETLQRKLEEKDKEVSNLTTEQQRLVREAKTQQSMTSALQRKFHEKQQRAALLSKEQQRLTKTTDRLQSKVQSQQVTLHIKDEQLDEKAKQLDQLTSEQERLSQECATLQATVKTQQQMLGKKEHLLTRATSKHTKVTKQLQGLHASLQQKEERAKSLLLQLRNLSENRRDAQLALKKKEESIKQLQGEIQLQQQQLAAKKQKMSNFTVRQRGLNKELKESKRVLSRREERVKFLVAQLSSLNQKFKDAHAVIQEKEEQAQQYQVRVQAAERALAEKDVQLEEHERTIEDLQAAKKALEAQVREFRQNWDKVLNSRSWRLTGPLRKLFDSPHWMPLWLKFMRQRCSLKLSEFRKACNPRREYPAISLASLKPGDVETGQQDAREAVRWISYIQIYQDDKQALFTHPPAKVSYRLKVPRAAVFQTSVALLPEAWGQNPGGVEFNICITARNNGRSVKRKLWNHPTRFPNHRRWMELRMSLRRFANQEVDLTLSTSVPPGEPEDFALAAWGDPVILTRRQKGHAEKSGTNGKQPEFSTGINLVGFLNSEKGLGEAVRSEIRDFEAAGIPYALNNVEDPGAENSETVQSQVSEHNPYDVNLIHMNADQIPFFARRNKEYFLDRYNIGYWVWELPSFPQEWHDRFEHFNEIWVPSNFALDTISRVSPIPVIRVPHSINPIPKIAQDWPRSRFGLKPDSFVFLFMFDFCSYFERKNPMGLVRAFKKAFSGRDEAVLFIKCSHSNFDEEAFAQLQEACRPNNIKLLDSVLPREAVNALLFNSDCYASLHRSEGFGLTMPEAMQLGKPVIATAYSSNMDYMKPSNSFLVKNRLVALDRDHGPYQKGCMWAEPDEDHAAELMRYVYENQSAAAAVAEKGREDVLAYLHPRVIGGQIKERLALLQSQNGPRGSANFKSSVPGNRRNSFAAVSYRIGARFRSKIDKTRKSARRINDFSTLLTRGNFARLVNRVKLFGLVSNYRELSERIGSDALTPGIERSQVNTRPKDLKKPFSQVEETISVVIPTKNAGKDFHDLLIMIQKQQGFSSIEIIVVDSGSTDNTLKIAKQFRAKIVQIAADEFSHSYARNLGAEHASGDYVLFTVQDALPSGELWLHELYWALAKNDVAAVSCTELPRDDADLFYRATTWNHFNNFLELDSRDRIMSKPDEENYFTLRKNGQLSDVACLMPRDVILQYKFIGNYAEDLDLGVRLIKNGRKLAFLSSTNVIHSHNRPAYYHLRRGYVDDLWLSRIFEDHPRANVEVEHLLHDIITIYQVVNTVVCSDLQEVGLPCRIRDLSNIVMKKFRTLDNGLCSIVDNINNPYIDENFKSFLEKINKSCSLNGTSNAHYDGVLLGAMESFTKIIFEYMQNLSTPVDESMLQDFKSSLFKAFAFMCGVHLASCYFDSSVSNKKKLQDINTELSDEV